MVVPVAVEEEVKPAEEEANPAQTTPESTEPDENEEQTPDTVPVSMDTDQELSGESVTQEPVQHDEEVKGDIPLEEGGDQEFIFPVQELQKLDEMINKPRWVVPVLPDGELKILLEASIKLAKKGLDTQSAECQTFFREGLTISFTKILTDDAVNGWKHEIQRCIMESCKLLIDLCTTKLADDWVILLDLLAMVLNPTSKFHVYNGSKPSELVNLEEKDVYAKSLDSRTARGWLVDLINRFGRNGGFETVKDRFLNGPANGQPLSFSIISALIRPFGQCHEVLTTETVLSYFLPIVDVVTDFLEKLTDAEMKKESKNESKNDALSALIKGLKFLIARVPGQENKIRDLEIFRLKMILRLLKISSFNGKMNALNEVNKVISNVSYYHQRHGSVPPEDEEWLTADRMANWIQENEVLDIVLRDSLHQPQYVEKLEKILRFMIKEKALQSKDLDLIWEAQHGKHDAIVKNIHELLAKLAWDFSPEQLDHLFQSFQDSWHHANKKQREKLLELIRRLAEDDKEGVMAQKVLGLLWNLAHSDECPTDIMDQALAALIKILDYSCSQDRDQHKIRWIYRFVDELKTNARWVLPALKQISEICKLFTEAPATYGMQQPGSRAPHIVYRNNVISELQAQHSIVMTVAQNLTQYIEMARLYAKANPEVGPEDYLPDDRFNHIQQVSDRLKFLRFLLKDGQLWLCAPQAKQIWNCLAIHAVFASDREACFKWFTKLMGDDPDLDPEITRDFFVDQILRLDPALLTESGMGCFDRFFRNVNTKENRLMERRKGLVMDDLQLVGIDYLWRVILHGTDVVASKAISLMKELHANLGPKLHAEQVAIHGDFINDCFERLRASFDTLQCLAKDSPEERQIEANRMVRVLTVLREYICECDDAYGQERAILSLSRSCRGRPITLSVQFPSQSRQEELKFVSHTNDTLGSVRRQVLQKSKVFNNNCKVELYLNGELLDPQTDKSVMSQIPIRDKTILTAKLVQANSNMASASDSSSESSQGASPGPGSHDGPNVEAERCLPGVILASDENYIPFLLRLCDHANSSSIPLVNLLESCKELLKLTPPHTRTIEEIRNMCIGRAQEGTQYSGAKLESRLFHSAAESRISPSKAVYTLEVIYSLLMPSRELMSESTMFFQRMFIESGGVSLALKALSQNDFLFGADLASKRDAILLVLRISKLTLLSAAHAVVNCVAERLRRNEPVNTDEHRAAVQLQEDLQHIPLPGGDPLLKHVAHQLAKQLMAKACQVLPNESTIRAVQKIAWAAASDSLESVDESVEDMQKAVEQMDEQMDDESIAVQLTCIGLEVLTLCLTLNPETVDTLQRDKPWQNFIIDMILVVKSSAVRYVAQDQFLLIARKREPTCRFFSTLLFTIEMVKVPKYASQCRQYFNLLCMLLNGQMDSQMDKSKWSQIESRLKSEIKWLMDVRAKVMSTGITTVEDALLEGHLGVARELILPLDPSKKFNYGVAADGDQLVKHLMEDFIFPASRVLMESDQGHISDISQGHSTAVCPTPVSVNAAYELLVALCTRCVQNLSMVARMLSDMFYRDEDTNLVEWEYLPPVGSRPQHGFVGLKNGGATCYMNSVLQQLFMIPEIRDGILVIDGVNHDLDEAQSQSDLKSHNTLPSYSQVSPEKCEIIDNKPVESAVQPSEEQSEKAYHLGVVKQMQIIFAHLAYSKLQFFVPKGFWQQFKIQGEQVNLREQHDALEFMERLVDSCDEALKTLDLPLACSKVICGTYADQKICKGCPHRYSHEQTFTALNVEIRNHHHLTESLEQFVKGDLLEGANAYFCEKCGKKVDTVKRMCVKKLPKTLAIQLKRFEYDWERDCSIKFNDYFEFPRELDMEPYTVYGLAKLEGEKVMDEEGEKSYADQSTKYRLSGVVVHSGQASGGHYYSYIQHRPSPHSEPKWYKYDDGDVSECRMDDDEELKKECFGGEYTGEMFDHMLKRMSFKRQKRWWNAYILMYERVDKHSDDVEPLTKEISSLSLGESDIKIPVSIERIVRRQNLQFMHNRNQFCPEFFHFMKKLLNCNSAYVMQHHSQCPNQDLPAELEELSKISAQLASKFLFSVGFHTKKTLRGAAGDWYEALSSHIRASRHIRAWFAENVLFAHPHRFSGYLLECPITEVRNTFAKIIAFLAHCARQDGPCEPPKNLNLYGDSQPDENATLSDHLLVAVLALLRKEVSEHGKYITQYFHLFVMYANLGPEERKQLLNLNVAELFIQVALDEGPGPTIKYQYAELTKLYSVVSLLVRDCDTSSECQGNEHKGPVGLNPYGLENPSSVRIQPRVVKLLFKSKAFIKKIIEDNITSEDTRQLMLYLCWENPTFSAEVLSELLWQVAYCYTHEMKPYLDLLQSLLQVEDSWQANRIKKSLLGSPEDKDGLFDVIHKSKNHYQKRAYQCIKMLTALFSKCEAANKILYSDDAQVMERWTSSVDWLNEEMERRTYGGNSQYAYNNWSPPTQSNETSNGYFLERSQSAKLTLTKALELCPEEESGEASDITLDNIEDATMDEQNSQSNADKQTPPENTQDKQS